MSAQDTSYNKRRKRDSERKARAVLSAAGKCFSQTGFSKTSTATIAQHAGVSKGLVFHFYGDKKSLFRAVVEDSLANWSLLSDYRAGETNNSALAELQSLFLASFDFVEQHPVLSLFASKDEALIATYKEDFKHKNISWRRRIRKVLKQGIQQAEINPTIDVARVSVIFHELQTSLLSNASLRGTQASFDRPTVNLAIALLLRGIALNPSDVSAN